MTAGKVCFPAPVYVACSKAWMRCQRTCLPAAVLPSLLELAVALLGAIGHGGSHCKEQGVLRLQATHALKLRYLAALKRFSEAAVALFMLDCNQSPT